MISVAAADAVYSVSCPLAKNMESGVELLSHAPGMCTPAGLAGTSGGVNRLFLTGELSGVGVRILSGWRWRDGGCGGGDRGESSNEDEELSTSYETILLMEKLRCVSMCNTVLLS